MWARPSYYILLVVVVVMMIVFQMKEILDQLPFSAAPVSHLTWLRFDRDGETAVEQRLLSPYYGRDNLGPRVTIIDFDGLEEMEERVLEDSGNVLRQAGYCVIYGDCYGLPCVRNTPAKNLTTSESQSIVEELCPSLSPEKGYCCDSAQVTVLKHALSRGDRLLHRCPVAKKNFRTLFCDMMCSPNQSRFIEVTLSEEFENRVRALHLRHFLSEAYSNVVYHSIKGHTRLLCGNDFLSDCTKTRVFTALGENRLFCDDSLVNCANERIFHGLGDHSWTELKTEYVIERLPSRNDVHHALHDHMSCNLTTAGSCSCFDHR